jgi:hypothetical protein
MNIATALVAQTVPFAVVVGNDSRWRDFFTVCYIGAVGLLLSLIAGFDDLNGLTDFIGLSVEALQY